MKCPLPSTEQLRAWAADGENEMCWGLDSVADELERLRGAISNSLRWIPVNERLPEECQLVAARFASAKPFFDAFYYSSTDADWWPAVTHWMPLPEAPK